MIRHLLKIVWRRKRLNSLLMVEIFFSFLVVFAVVTAGLFLWNNYRRPLGFDYRDTWNVQIDVNQEGDEFQAGGQALTFAAVLREAETLPSVVAVAGAQDVPFDGSTSVHVLELEGRPVRMQVSEVTDRFAEVLGLHVTAGRWFEESDDVQPWAPVVINRRLARELYGDEDPIGRTPPFKLGGREVRIVGMVDDYRKGGEFSTPVSYLFQRIRVGNPEGRLPRDLLLRMSPGADQALEEEITRRLQAVARDWSFEVRVLTQMRETDRRMALAPLLAGGIVAGFLMVMVGLGLIGVLWQNVTQRTREIGLRRATGATAVQVRRQILGELWVLSALGMALGVVLVVQLPILDVVSFLPGRVLVAGIVLSTGLILGLATLSGLYPSWLATRVHPVEALHCD